MKKTIKNAMSSLTAKLAALRGLPADALETLLEENAARFLGGAGGNLL